VTEIPSVLDQGLLATRVQHPADVRNYNSGLERRGAEHWLATRRFDRDVWGCVIDINQLDPATGSVARVCTLALPRPLPLVKFEDARLFWHRDKLHVAYTEGHYYQRPWRAVQQLAVLREDWSVERVVTVGFGKNTIGQEKNWQFFSKDGQLHFIYSLSPYVVVSLDDDYGVASVACDDRPRPAFASLRGGTPPVRLGDQYVAFPHSHTEEEGVSRRYSFSAYTFSARTLELTGVTGPLVTASGRDLRLPNPMFPHWTPLVVFPCGALRTSAGWLISAGVNDSFDVLFQIPDAKLDFRSTDNIRPA
jgi:predicted GH43/DUF377 family glycosyl hydrolase